MIKDDPNILGSESVGKLLWRMSMPAVVGMFVQALYNVVDAFFVGRGSGPLGIAAVFVSFPIQITVLAFGQMLGFGGVSVFSRNLGAGNRERAERTAGTLITASLFIGILLASINIVFAEKLVTLFGASANILSDAASYSRIVALGAPLFCMSMVLNNIARGEGNAKLAMWTMLISGILNCFLDPLFIFTFKMGVAGAAWATVISQCFGAIWLIWWYSSGRSSITIRMIDFIPDFGILSDTIKIGASSFVRQIGMAFALSVLNNVFADGGGDIAVAAYGVLQRVLSFIFMPAMGISIGMLPIIGYNYGAKMYDRVFRSMHLATVVSTLLCLFGAFVLLYYPELIFLIFADDPRLLQAGEFGARAVGCGLGLVGFQLTVSGFYQGIGRALPSLFLSTLRPILLITPLVYIFESEWGIKGAWLAFPITDVISFYITLIMFRRDKLRLIA